MFPNLGRPRPSRTASTNDHQNRRTKTTELDMCVTTETGEPAIRPFTIETPEADLDDLRERIARTRWPEKETVADQSQGPQLATMQALARYWAEEYDWRKCEEKLI